MWYKEKKQRDLEYSMKKLSSDDITEVKKRN